MDKQSAKSDSSEEEQSLSEPNVYVSITHNPLDSNVALSGVKSPKAGAVVLFAGTPSTATLQKTLFSTPH